MCRSRLGIGIGIPISISICISICLSMCIYVCRSICTSICVCLCAYVYMMYLYVKARKRETESERERERSSEGLICSYILSSACTQTNWFHCSDYSIFFNPQDRQLKSDEMQELQQQQSAALHGNHKTLAAVRFAKPDFRTSLFCETAC